MNREAWLNGWHRTGGIVLLGSSAYCAGCGEFNGTVNVFIPLDFVVPEELPDWPFNDDDCPLCRLNCKEHDDD